MGIISSNKLVDRTVVACGDLTKITLALTAAPDITSNPTDIVLVLDRSGSMMGSALANLKLGANTFIDIIDESTDGAHDGQIGGGSRIGIVSFADTANEDTQLITSVADLKAAVGALAATGNTNHADAFLKARELFDPASTNAKVLIMFTDGETTTGGPPLPQAEAAKAAGITVYCIGLIGQDGIDVATLNSWASDPVATHVAVTPDAADLEALFGDLAENISKPGATNILIDEFVNANFEITSFDPPTKGAVNQISPTNLQWTIDQLGATTTESAQLDFYVEYAGPEIGEMAINAAVNYSDTEGNVVTFPSPQVDVICLNPVIIDTCPFPVDIAIDGCTDYTSIDLDAITITDGGSILDLNLTIADVCPGKRVALAVILTEINAAGESEPRGMKTITIPAHDLDECTDINIDCIKFVLPIDLLGDVTMCTPRNLQVRTFANYIDNNFSCCPPLV